MEQDGIVLPIHVNDSDMVASRLQKDVQHISQKRLSGFAGKYSSRTRIGGGVIQPRLGGVG